MATKNIMIVGVGGQGTLLTSRILGGLALAGEYDVKLSEVHGMAQRGGSVVTYVRYGENVAEPIVEEGQADVIIAFEKLEALRYAHFLKKDGALIVNDWRIDPSIIALVCGSERYAKGLKETLQFISDQIMLFYTPESAKTKLGRHKPNLWIVTEDMTSQPNQPWCADRTTPVILITGNPDAVEIKKNSGKLTVLSMPLSIVDLRKTVEIYVS